MDPKPDPRCSMEMYLAYREEIDRRLAVEGFILIEERLVLIELEREAHEAFRGDPEAMAAAIASIGFEQLWEIDAYRTLPASRAGIV